MSIGEAQQTMYTIEELVEIATAEGEKVSARQIMEWNRDGLLPTPTREKLPGQGRGRAPYRFPDPAPSAVMLLARERHYMRSSKDAKLWLWLEGFDYTGVDPDEDLHDWLTEGWEKEVRAKAPSVPELPDADQVDYDRRYEILNEVDRNIISKMGNGEHHPEEYAVYSSLLAGVLGIDPPEGDEPMKVERAAKSLLPYTMRRMLPAWIYRTFPDLISEEFAALSIPEAIGKPIPRKHLRDIWKTFWLMTEVADEPLEAFPLPGFAAVIRSLRKLRYSLYRESPELVIHGLSCAVRYLLRTRPNRLQETMDAAKHLRESMQPQSVKLEVSPEIVTAEQ